MLECRGWRCPWEGSRCSGWKQVVYSSLVESSYDQGEREMPQGELSENENKNRVVSVALFSCIANVITLLI